MSEAERFYNDQQKIVWRLVSEVKLCIEKEMRQSGIESFLEMDTKKEATYFLKILEKQKKVFKKIEKINAKTSKKLVELNKPKAHNLSTSNFVEGS